MNITYEEEGDDDDHHHDYLITQSQSGDLSLGTTVNELLPPLKFQMS